jgi:diguanylate cyclase (GGDEF)-like protein
MADDAHDESGRAERDPTLQVWLLTVALATVAALLLVPGILHHPQAALPDLTWLGLLPLFALAEVVVIHLPTQRNAHGHTLREIPAVLGLTFLAPQQYATAFVLGAVAALVVAARMRGVKLAFNASMFALEAALGLLTYHVVLQGEDPLSVHGWAAVLIAVLVTDLISAAAVTAAISLTEGAFEREVLREVLRSGMVAAFINTCVALLIATLVVVQPTALPLLGVVVVCLVGGYRIYISLARGNARTQLLYRFVDRTAAASSAEEVVRLILAESAELMHTDRAYLVDRSEEGDGVRFHFVEEGSLRTETIEDQPTTAWWWPAFEDGVVRYAAPKASPAEDGSDFADEVGPASGAPSKLCSPRDGLAAPLREAGSTRYVLAVCDRSFDKETFGDDDVQVFSALAAHAGVAVERARTVTDLENLAEQRAFEARHDALSGLLNRRAFNDAVAEAMQTSVGTGPLGSGVVLLLDLDNFKDVNDTLGHSAGDHIIKVSASRLREHADGLVARLGGDEFAVLMAGTSLDQGVKHAQQLHDALSVSVPLGEVKLTVSASIGVAQFSPLTESAEDLLAQADLAMYTAKSDRSGVAVYHPEAGDLTARRLALAGDLPGAIESGEVQLWFQPQADAQTGAITGFEALVRWPHPGFGMIPPGEIIAIAHRTGHMRRLTDAIISLALAARRGWLQAGHEMDVAVNVTTRDISDPTLVERLRQVLAETGTPSSALTLEITESDAMKDPERSLVVLHDIREMGVDVSIDDFGTGYSSLAYLDRLPVREVKIDQSFVFRLERDATDATIVRATVGLAHDLGLRVVAEGVENELARTLVAGLGVDLYQGYGLARPMPAAEVLGWLARHGQALGDAPGPSAPLMRDVAAIRLV